MPEKNPEKLSAPGFGLFSGKKLTIIFWENEPLMRETNFTLDPIQKSLYLLLLHISVSFAQNRPKPDISTGINTLHYIKSFCNGIGGWDQV